MSEGSKSKRSAEPKTKATAKVAKTETAVAPRRSARNHPEPSNKPVTKSKPAEKKSEPKNEPKKESEANVDTEVNTKTKSDSKVVEGQMLPSGFKLQSEDETMVDLNELTKKSGFVIFFYPKANTGGCTKQACGFRDNYDIFKKAGYEVFGMSADKPTPQSNWKAKHNFQYKLLCDPEFTLLKRFGVAKSPKGIKRSHIIVGKGGKVEKVAIQISPGDSVAEATSWVQN